MPLSLADKAKADADEAIIITLSALIINIVSSVTIFVIFGFIVYMLAKKTRTRIQRMTKKFKSAEKRIRNYLSPSAEQVLALCNIIGIPKDKVVKIYAEYDMHRRKVTTKYLHFDDSEIAEIKIFQKFFNESHFMKRGGFRTHRLLHELTVSPPTTVIEQVRTVLAPAFK